MRVVLVGRPRSRAALRASLAGFDLEVAGEAISLAEARDADPGVDAFLLATDALVAPVDRLDDDLGAESLTPREQDVLELLTEGLSNKSIAARLGISDQTVKFHVAAVCGKLGVSNRTEAVRRALRRGLIAI